MRRIAIPLLLIGLMASVAEAQCGMQTKSGGFFAKMKARKASRSGFNVLQEQSVATYSGCYSSGGGTYSASYQSYQANVPPLTSFLPPYQPPVILQATPQTPVYSAPPPPAKAPPKAQPQSSLVPDLDVPVTMASLVPEPEPEVNYQLWVEPKRKEPTVLAYNLY